MAKKSFTLMVIPDHDAPVKRYTIQRSFLMQVGMGLMLVVGLASGASIHYFQVAADASENRILREENLT
ncbi:MAG TPA: M23 family peptidase, partial [Myxococcus sp.]|nr:M23 family peptidase [Myxococcus sp.]